MSAAAIVLGGGQTQRMGVEKATLVVDGATLLDRTVAVVAAAGIDKIVVVAPGHVPDPEPAEGRPHRQGPMAGVVAGWRQIREGGEDPVVVLSCDLPALSSSVVTELVAESSRAQHGAVAFDGERRQPLIAAYRRPALIDIEASFLAGQRSLRACFDDWDLRSVTFASQLLADADKPADLANYEVEWPGQHR